MSLTSRQQYTLELSGAVLLTESRTRMAQYQSHPQIPRDEIIKNLRGKNVSIRYSFCRKLYCFRRIYGFSSYQKKYWKLNGNVWPLLPSNYSRCVKGTKQAFHLGNNLCLNYSELKLLRSNTKNKKTLFFLNHILESNSIAKEEFHSEEKLVKRTYRYVLH